MIIASCIVIYTIWHKRSAWAVIPMGLCRGFLPVMGALGMMEMPVNSWNIGFLCLFAIFSVVAGAGLFCYIMGLSLQARYESRGQQPKSPRLPGILFLIAGVLMTLPFLFSGKSFFLSGKSVLLAFNGLIAYCVWLSLCRTWFRKPISRHVSALLAGIPLLDWILLLPISLLLISEKPLVDPLSIACFAIPPLAFILALLLQRLAPAT